MESADIVVGNLEALRGTGHSHRHRTTSGPGIPRSTTSSATRFTRSRSTARSSRTLATNPADAGIVRAVIEMAHGLNLNVSRRGRRDQDQFLHLQRFGCDEMQGYWVSPPSRPKGQRTHGPKLEMVGQPRVINH